MSCLTPLQPSRILAFRRFALQTLHPSRIISPALSVTQGAGETFSLPDTVSTKLTELPAASLEGLYAWFLNRRVSSPAAWL